MQKQSVRVLLASEHPGTRSYLRRMVETEDKAVIVAEAENGTRALNLARRFHPDVALIDSYLPSVVGFDNIPLSRVGGLETAQSISEEIPAMHVVLLNSLSDSIPAGSAWGVENSISLCRESNETCIPFKLGDLRDRTEFSSSLIFANIETHITPILTQKARLSDKVILGGVLAVIAGWLMILTMFLATPGIFGVLGGGFTVLVGFIGKLWSKGKSSG